MKYGSVGASKKVSHIVYGCTNADMLAGRDTSFLLDRALMAGINTFDTARVYGGSEKSLGLWLKRQKREEIVVISKCCHPSETWEKRVGRKELLSDLEISLNTLETDYIDVYLLHRDDERVPVQELIDTLNACKAQGKINAFGVSNWRRERIVEANDYALSHGLSPLCCSSPQLSLLEKACDPYGNGCLSLSYEERPSLGWYRETQFPVLSYSSLAQGLLSDRFSASRPEAFANVDEALRRAFVTDGNLRRLGAAEALAKEKHCRVSQIALAWLFTQGLNIYALVSSSSPERIQSNAEALDIELTEDDLKRLQ